MLNNNTHMTQATASMWTGRNSWEEYVALERYCYTHSTDTYSEHITPSPPHYPTHPHLYRISYCNPNTVAVSLREYQRHHGGVIIQIPVGVWWCVFVKWRVGGVYTVLSGVTVHTLSIILGEGEYNLYTYCMLYKPWPVEEDKGIFSKLKKKSKIVKHWKSLI